MPDLVERLRDLAEGGVPRGSEAVWRAAQAQLEPLMEPASSMRSTGPRRRWMLGGVSVVIAAVLVAVVVAVDPSDHTQVSTPRIEAPPAAMTGRWRVVDKGASGLGVDAVPYSLVSTGRAFLVGGMRQSSAAPRGVASIWRSTDGLRWVPAVVPATTGLVSAVAVRGNEALAIGGSGVGVSSFVWHSSDDGRTWQVVVDRPDVFGRPVPVEGRPFVAGLLSARGGWVASGGGPDGHEAIWTSRDGRAWRQVLHTTTGGAATVVPGGGGGLFAYWSSVGWFSRNASQWSQPHALRVPGRLFLGDGSVAAGASLAAGHSQDQHGTPTPLLRSRDQGRSWVTDDSFLGRFPSAVITTIVTVGGLRVATGTSGTPNHPDAWISHDSRNWQPMPPTLYGDPGGVLNLAAGREHQVVMMSGAPELQRYYTYEPGARPTSPARPAQARLVECPLARQPLHGTPDGLPPAGQTDHDRVVMIAQSGQSAIRHRYPGVMRLSVQPRNGQVWQRQPNGQVVVVDAHDYLLEAQLNRPAACPRSPQTWNGVPLRFVVATRRSGHAR